jgi:hypothetical protein
MRNSLLVAVVMFGVVACTGPKAGPADAGSSSLAPEGQTTNPGNTNPGNTNTSDNNNTVADAGAPDAGVVDDGKIPPSFQHIALGAGLICSHLKACKGVDEIDNCRGDYGILGEVAFALDIDLENLDSQRLAFDDTRAQACVDAFRAAASSCEIYGYEALEITEACLKVTEGTQQFGQECLSNMECVSDAFCNEGRCDTRLTVGTACSAETALCAKGAYCDAESLKCVKFGAPFVGKKEGEVCAELNECGGYMFCGTDKKCSAPAELNAACTPALTYRHQCKLDSFCSATESKCVTRLAEGATCAASEQCSAGDYCDPTPKVCKSGG